MPFDTSGNGRATMARFLEGFTPGWSDEKYQRLRDRLFQERAREGIVPVITPHLVQRTRAGVYEGIEPIGSIVNAINPPGRAPLAAPSAQDGVSELIPSSPTTSAPPPVPPPPSGRTTGPDGTPGTIDPPPPPEIPGWSGGGGGTGCTPTQVESCVAGFSKFNENPGPEIPPDDPSYYNTAYWYQALNMLSTMSGPIPPATAGGACSQCPGLCAAVNAQACGCWFDECSEAIVTCGDCCGSAFVACPYQVTVCCCSNGYTQIIQSGCCFCE